MVSRVMMRGYDDEVDDDDDEVKEMVVEAMEEVVMVVEAVVEVVLMADLVVQLPLLPLTISNLANILPLMRSIR